jgi:hypothetical protein
MSYFLFGIFIYLCCAQIKNDKSLVDLVYNLINDHEVL